MQKVEGSNPFSRSRKGQSICRAFLRAQSACAPASGRTDSGLAPGRSSAVPKKTPCLQAHSGPSEPKSLCGVCRRSGVRLLRPVAPTPAPTARPQRTAPAGAIPGGGTSGPVRFQSGNREVNLGPLSGNPRRAMAPRGVSFSGDGVRRSFGVPIRRTLCRGSHTGVIAEGVAFHRQPDVLPAPGLGCWSASRLSHKRRQAGFRCREATTARARGRSNQSSEAVECPETAVQDLGQARFVTRL
jgi:hypothetical protein